MKIEYTNERCLLVERFLRRNELEIDNLQAYIPYIDKLKKRRITKWSTIKLEKRIIEVLKSNPYKGIIADSSGNREKVLFHIKCTPILEPVALCRNEYTGFNNHHWLANCNTVKYVYLCNKVNSMKNTAYIDTLCSILLNKLRNEIKTPHFGNIYGTYSGIYSEYEEEITEEYLSLVSEKWFQRIINNGKYRLKIVNEKKTDEKQFMTKFLEDNSDNIEVCDLDSYAIEIPESSIPMKSEMDDDAKYYLVHPKVPVQIVFMEKFDKTFEDLINDLIYNVRNTQRSVLIRNFRKNMVMNRLRSWIFQICAGLCCANKNIDFVHNDLHIQNVMGLSTNEKFLYYVKNGVEYKVPTYGYIMKIIDFGRSTYTFNGKYYIGDIFDEDGEAGGQYTTPSCKCFNTNKEVKPHPAFDLARFACSFVEDLEESIWPTKDNLNEYDIGSLINNWTVNDDGQSLMDIEGFDLYINIARHFRTRDPYSELDSNIFGRYIKEHSQDEKDSKIIYDI
tara:strand:- start:2 stop:1516 length:1515 start_codon:yes stop_codon:yes gene_type:complete